MKRPLTLDDYMNGAADRRSDPPLRLRHALRRGRGLPGDDRVDVASDLRLQHATLLSTIERHNAFPDDPIQMRGGWAMDVDELYAMAGAKPDGIDVLETYDDYPVIVMMQFEDLGFCGKGEAADFVRAHDLTNGGSFPHNTSGGQLSAGQAGAAAAISGSSRRCGR